MTKVNQLENWAEGGEEKEQLLEKTEEEKPGVGEYFFILSQIGVVVIYTFFTEYSVELLPKNDVNGNFKQPNTNIYTCFQDVNVMIFIGFGFLMTYIKAQGLSALSFNWLISIWCIEWGILTQAYFHGMFTKETGLVQIDLNSLIMGLFAAATGMITYGALLGKCSLQQLLFLTLWEMVFWGLNMAICVDFLGAVDMGGSIVIHAFGAYFGLAASYFFQPKRAANDANNQSGHQSELIALVGSVFLWMYWPSFNGALATNGAQQQRVFTNTNLSIAAGCMAAAFMSRVWYGKLEMTIVMNATLAGGVTIGTNSDLVTSPAGAMWIGMIAGSFSAFAFDKIGGVLADKINLQDTCGVHSLHGMPGVLGGVISAFVISQSASSGFHEGYFPSMTTSGTKDDYTVAAITQIYAVVITVSLAIFSGLVGGKIAGLNLWKPPKVLFKDDDHFHGVKDRYPEEYKELS